MQRHSPTSLPGPRSQSGAFLIEALIAIVVFSIGMLAILRVVGTMQVNSSDSRYRVEAAQYADSIFSEMRTADPATLAASYATTGTRYTYWSNRISTGGLPLVGAGTASQLTIAASGSEYTITVRWRAATDKDTDTGGTGIAHQYVTSTTF